MVDRNIISKLGLTAEEVDKQVSELFTNEHDKMLSEVLEKNIEALVPGTIVKGRIVTQLGNDVIVELGLKSEGIVDASEFDQPEEIQPGKELEVLLEEVDAEGSILLSKRKADRIRGWEHVITHHAEGDVLRNCQPPNQRRSVGGYRGAGVPAGLAGGHPQTGRYQPVYRRRN